MLSRLLPIASRGRPVPALYRRHVSTSPPADIQPIDLEFDSYVPPNGNAKEGPLVILHGLLGSKRNWQSLSKAFAKELNRPVYALDLRNHGHSQHASPHNYPALAADVRHFISQQGLTDVQLLGHSMGGKVAMTVALSDESQANNLLGKLVVADIAPSRGSISDEFGAYVRRMRDLNEQDFKTRKEAQAFMSEVEQDPAVLAFLLTNVSSSTDDSFLRFRLPLSLLLDHIPDIGSFPYEPGQKVWDGPALFVKGEKSKFINRKNLPDAEKFFPSMKLETLDAGHWVHAERPREFGKLLLDFVGRGKE